MLECTIRGRKEKDLYLITSELLLRATWSGMLQPFPTFLAKYTLSTHLLHEELSDFDSMLDEARALKVHGVC